MVGLLADVGSGYFSDLYSAGGVGLSGPVGLSNDNGGNPVGLGGGVGLSDDTGSGDTVGLTGGVGFFA